MNGVTEEEGQVSTEIDAAGLDATLHASFEQAAFGAYLDFEGFTNKPPALMGILYPDRFEQIVLDPRLREAARAKNLRVQGFEDAINDLINECLAHDRVLFAFTRHELNLVVEYTDIGSRFLAIYKDGHKIAKRWFNRFHHGEPIQDKSLDGFMGFIGHPRSSSLLAGHATNRLRAVIEMSADGRLFEDLTPVVKAKWTKLLKYNKADCEDLKELVTKAASELCDSSPDH